MGNKGLEYGRSYANSGLKAFAKSFEELNSNIFFCQYAQELLSTSKPHDLLRDAIINLTHIASYVFTEQNLEFAIHSKKEKFNLIQMKLEMLLNQIKNENSRYSEKSSNVILLPKEFQQPIYHQTFFKTPLAVNNCVESMLGPTYANEKEYGVGLVLSELLTFNSMIPLIREKGGAYGAGCAINESGLINFYSYRDPKVNNTYDNFERSVQDILDGRFGDKEMQESKLLAF
jgi:Zn-dependent M16 (insulinase) family peptidase